MKITKNDFYQNLKDIFKTSCNFFIHGISDDPDIKNKFTSMDNEEIAKKILQEGLYNNYNGTISRTCYSFGRITDYEPNKFHKFTSYIPYKSRDPFVNVIVAIPICFIDDNNNRYFGGWIDSKKYSLNQYNSLLDWTIREEKIIPKEFILGYYTHKNDSDEIDITINKSHYYFLSKEEQTNFIKHNKLNTMFNLDKDNPYHYAMKYLCDGVDNIFLEQLDVFTKEKSQALTHLDYEKIKFIEYPTFEQIINGDVDIRKELINHDYQGYSILKDISFYYYNPTLENQAIEIEYFEEWVESFGNDPINLYKYLYDNFTDEVINIYKEKLNKKSL